jgi:ATP/maltotriose-dependent transcriptional regulator MalT
MTRLSPPAQQARLLPRLRVDDLINEAINSPLTLVIAPAGYGKTTALAGFRDRSPVATVWCRMVVDDDPISLVCNIVATFRSSNIIQDDRICTRIVYGIGRGEPGAAPPHAPRLAIQLLVNELSTLLSDDVFLVLDDYHKIDEQPTLRNLIEYFINILPKKLHVLIATRYRPTIRTLPTLYARGEVYEIGHQELAFTPDEAEALFTLYERSIPADCAKFTSLCRGWPLALQLLVTDPTAYQSAASPSILYYSSTQPTFPTGDETTHRLSSCFRALRPLLRGYLLQQVFDEQPPDIQTFLLHTAALRWFNDEVCNAIPRLHDVAIHQDEVIRRNLFIEQLYPSKFAYQPIFKAFLSELMKERLDNWQEIHCQAAEYYRGYHDQEGVTYHLLEIEDVAGAATTLEHVAGEWLHRGRAWTLLTWLDRLPEEYQQRPPLLEARAAAYRQLGKFEEALAVYKHAEKRYEELGNREGQSHTLVGQAKVYLDTVQPTPAAALLKRALKLLPKEHRQERAEILLLQAENWANRGRADVAFHLETSAKRLASPEQEEHSELAHSQASSPSSSASSSQSHSVAPSLPPRLLLRSGRLNESRHLLEAQLGLESQSQSSHTQHAIILAHREPLLLLALLYAMLGNGARALAMALRGLLEAMHSGSQLTEAIAHMRVGHAHQVITPLDDTSANRHYNQALELAQSFGVTRTKVEIFMGLALLHGHASDLVKAEMVADEGLQIARDSGDEWIAATIWLALGGAAVAASDSRAVEWLNEAHRRFVHGGDSYGQAVVALWRALWYLRHGEDTQQVHEQMSLLLELTHKYGYEGLLTAPTLFGPRDMAMLIPLLLHGRTMEEHAAFSQQLLRQAFPTIATDDSVGTYHPGYTLRIQMMGSFRVWRGTYEIQGRDWQREKARQLLQLLLTYRGQWVQREQICLWLWPDSDLDAAERQFKVTLNALNAALEPFRPPRTTPFFVRRQGLAYSFAPSYGCWIDVDEFELRTTNIPQSDPDFVIRNAQVAVNLYKGDYLAESLYDPWTLEERERLLARYLATATALADRLVEKGDIQHAIQLCEQVMRRDRCFEEAYQVLIRAYARSGSRSQALRSYTRCIQALQDDLGIDPLPETTDLYERIKRNENV